MATDSIYIETGKFHVFVDDNEKVILDEDGMDMARFKAIVALTKKHPDEYKALVGDMCSALIEQARDELRMLGTIGPEETKEQG